MHFCFYQIASEGDNSPTLTHGLELLYGDAMEKREVLGLNDKAEGEKIT